MGHLLLDPLGQVGSISKNLIGSKGIFQTKTNADQEIVRCAPRHGESTSATRKESTSQKHSRQW
jgi:hypothetical protein